MRSKLDKGHVFIEFCLAEVPKCVFIVSFPRREERGNWIKKVAEFATTVQGLPCKMTFLGGPWSESKSGLRP